MALKIALDAGHGMNTPGKRTPDGEREWSFNDKVLRSCEASLRRYKGVQILRTDDASGRTDVSLAERVRRANAWGADVFVSFHHNAMSGAWHSGGGTEVYAANSASAKSVALAKTTAPKIAKAMGLANRGVKRANFYVIRYTKMPAILVEGGFMDSRVDIVPMRNDAKLRAQGEAVAEAIIATFGLKAPAGDVAQISAPKPKPAPKPAAGGMDYSKYRYGVTLKQGMGGAAVKRFQTDMNTLGYKLATDGSYGPASAAAVRKFQAANRLTVDGIAGVATQAKMTELLAAKKAPAKDKTIYRVIIDGKQVGAYSENDNAIAEARKAIAGGAKNIRIEKV